MKLIASKPLLYAGQSLNVGDEFEASEKDAKILKAIRKAEDAPVAPAKTVEPEPLQKRTYKTRRMKADDSGDEDPSEG